MERAKDAFRALRAIRTGASGQQKAELATWRQLLPADCIVGHAYASTEALIMAQWIVPRNDTPSGDDDDNETTLAAGMIRPHHDYAILDEAGRPVAPGDTGELLIRSRYIALGEWRDGKLVPGRMTPAPGRPGWRIFRTGDLVRVRADGMLRVVGRADRQVKINGVRIEPAAIEAVLRSEPSVSDAVVVTSADTTSVRLHGFVVAASVDRPDLIATLRRRLAANLPSASRPSRLTVLDRLPTLPSGKVDFVTLSHWPTDHDGRVAGYCSPNSAFAASRNAAREASSE